MKASSVGGLFGHLLLIAIIVQIVSQSDALTPLETCKIVKDKSFIADPADCQGWYYCLNREPIAGKCKSGLLYNSYTASCDYPTNVVCGANVTTMCTGLNGVFKRDPYNCGGYCYCTNGQTECTTCPDGQLFDPVVPSCTYADQTDCFTGSPCLLVSNDFIQNPGDCARWYLCNNGQISNGGTCNPGFVYDAFNGMCNYKAEVVCTIDSPAAAPAPSTPQPPAASACVGNAPIFLPDGATCRGYFYCDPATINGADSYILRWGQCPEGSQFSADDKKCTNPYNTKPPCPNGDRCEGSLMTYMAAPGTECAKYIVCSNNITSTNPAPCPTGYPFFNEKLQACVPTNPGFQICLPPPA